MPKIGTYTYRRDRRNVPISKFSFDGAVALRQKWLRVQRMPKKEGNIRFGRVSPKVGPDGKCRLNGESKSATREQNVN